MTYSELLIILQNISPDQLNQTVTIYDKHSDEYYSCTDVVYTTEKCDVLDADSIVLRF